MPSDMPYYDNWKLCNNIGSLACTLFVDILLHFEVHFLPITSCYPCFATLYRLSSNLFLFFKCRTKQFGPVLKLVLCLCITVPLLLWPLIGIIGSVIGGAAYGLLSPIFATFEAVGEGKTNEFFNCIYVS